MNFKAALCPPGGWCLGKADKEKKQVNLKAGLLILLEEVCSPGGQPREAPESKGSQTKVKQPAHILSAVFQDWRSAMSSLSPKLLLPPFILAHKLLALF